MTITGNKRKRKNAIEVLNIADSRNQESVPIYNRAFNPAAHKESHRKIIKKTLENFGIELKHQQKYTDIIFRTMIDPNGWLTHTPYPLDRNKILRCIEIIERKIDSINEQGDITPEVATQDPLMQTPFLKQEYQKEYALNVLKNTFFITQQAADNFVSYPHIDLNTDK